MNEVERDFVAFMHEKTGRAPGEIEQIYMRAKKRFRFATSEYRYFNDDVHALNELLYGDTSDEGIVAAMKFHELMHVYRFISYADASKPRPMELIRVTAMLLLRGEWKRFVDGLRHVRDMKKEAAHRQTPVEAAGSLTSLVQAPRTVVDYGCGLAYVSYEIARIDPSAEFYLLDVDCLTLEFAAYRLRRRGVKVTTIPVTPGEIYPKVPPHNICVATEVLEHVREPERAYENISSAMASGGVLYGDFSHHHEELFHVSTNLDQVNKRIADEYEQLSHLCFRKR